MTSSPHKSGDAPPPLKAGDWVRVSGMGGEGEIVEIDARRRRARVRVNAHEWTLPLGRLTPAAPPAPRREEPHLVRLTGGGAPIHEIDLHGQRVEEALTLADRALDQAVVHHLDRLKIVHGHGTGAVRTAIRRLLATHPQVESYRFGEPHEGGLACTVALLKPHPRAR
jgi:DNA mismatch repair protein MutS2